ncbi:MAG: 2'-5' RNA ligase family protein [Cyclobacteriaceae bacterium]|nr:2'-5' RNA ligase family protein [Cyclobacteriaceae bacterium]
MKKQAGSLRSNSGSSNELFFIISPSKSVVDYVAALKNHVKSAIGHTFEDEFSKAHISLFKYRDAHPERVLYQMDTKVSMFNPFHVYIKNLNFFTHGPNKRTIYLEIVYKNPICDVFQGITGQETGFLPHITIAKNLDTSDFLIAWNSLKNLSYSEYFKCDHITVLKKAPKKWMHYIDLPFAA